MHGPDIQQLCLQIMADDVNSFCMLESGSLLQTWLCSMCQEYGVPSKVDLRLGSGQVVFYF